MLSSSPVTLFSSTFNPSSLALCLSRLALSSASFFSSSMHDTAALTQPQRLLATGDGILAGFRISLFTYLNSPPTFLQSVSCTSYLISTGMRASSLANLRVEDQCCSIPNRTLKASSTFCSLSSGPLYPLNTACTNAPPPAALIAMACFSKAFLVLVYSSFNSPIVCRTAAISVVSFWISSPTSIKAAFSRSHSVLRSSTTPPRRLRAGMPSSMRRSISASSSRASSTVPAKFASSHVRIPSHTTSSLPTFSRSRPTTSSTSRRESCQNPSEASSTSSKDERIFRVAASRSSSHLHTLLNFSIWGAFAASTWCVMCSTHSVRT
mmetsp:Transcript_43074/g.107792  ORF Transcript_43074/g.107792 Transcript_43074/m.107792 type:complete len:323 (-) Transcript_43074:249-1217(-)